MSAMKKIQRILDEFEAAGGDPKRLVQKVESLLTFDEQNQHLTATRDGIRQGIETALNEEREALSARDDAVAAKKDAEKKLGETLERLGTMLKTEPEAEKIMKALDEAEQKLAQAKQQVRELEAFVIPGRWILSILMGMPDLLHKHREQILNLLDNPTPRTQYNEKIGELMIPLITRELKNEGSLVPKQQYLLAANSADTYKFRADISMNRIFRNPTRLNREQALAVVGALLDAGLNKDNIDQFRTKLEIAWRKCPTHKTELRADLRTLKFTCTYPGCGYVDW